MSYKVEEKLEETETRNECHHYWQIESATGPTSRGVCKFCGAEKVFYNSFPEFTYLKRDPRTSEFPDLLEMKSDEVKVDPELEEVDARA